MAAYSDGGGGGETQHATGGGGGETPSADEIRRSQKRMLENIANSGARISNQQKDETDLTLEEKVVILKEVFEKKPCIFAERFHMYLADEDMIAFENSKNEYEVQFYLNEAKKRLASKNSVIVKNRRYEALRKLEKEGVYFGDEAMNERAPFMYNYYVGQYRSEAEKKEKPYDDGNTDLKFSTVLMDFMHRKDREALFKKQREEEECMESEEDETDTEDEEEDEEQKEGKEQDEDEQGDIAHSSREHKVPTSPEDSITDEDKHMLRQEFMSRMRERFLSGEDEDFDYTSVDFNSEYDSVEMRTQDEQEKYFDGD